MPSAVIVSELAWQPGLLRALVHSQTIPQSAVRLTAARIAQLEHALEIAAARPEPDPDHLPLR